MTITILSILLLLHVFFANLSIHQKKREIERLTSLLIERSRVYGNESKETAWECKKWVSKGEK